MATAPLIKVDNVVVGESDGFAAFVVQLSAPSTSTVTVSFNNSNITAANGSDYTAKSGTLTFLPGQTSETVQVPITDNSTAEPTESFLFNLFSASNGVIGNSSAVATIIDNDAPTGTPVIEIGDRVVDESLGLVMFAVTLDRPSSGTVTVNYATAPGTAGTADYSSVSGALNFAPGEMVKIVSVPITNDTLAEGDERFDLLLSSPVGATLPDPRGTATIVANDQTAVANPIISVDNLVVGESDGFANFVVRLSAPSASIVTVSYNDSNITAVNGSDYNAMSGTLNFAPGETVKTVRVPIIDDTAAESTENFAFNLFSSSNAVIGNSQAMATIIDNDAPTGTPVIEIGDRIVDETAGEVTFAVTLDRPSTGTVTVNYATAPGTASTADYTTVTGTLAFAPGETVKTVSVPITNDTLAEGDERFDLALSAPVGATLPDPRGTATIVANDQTAVASPIISIDNVVVGESDGFAEFVVRLNAPSASIVEVSYNDSNETAANGSDYNAVSGTLNFAPGETVKTVRVPIINDTAAESREDFALNLFSPSNAVIGNSQAMATIIDNDEPSGPPVMEIGDRIVDEKAGEVTFAVTLDRPSTGTVKVNYATAPGTASTADYTTVTGTLAFAPGETVKTMSVPITNDTLAEGDERFDLVLSSPVGATLPNPQATATIAANDQTAVTSPIISVDNVLVGESDGFAEFVVRLNAPSASIVEVSYNDSNETAANGSDYNAVSGTLNFAPGETVKTVRVPIIDDTAAESREDFALNLFSSSNAVIGNSQAMATIIDNDAPSGPPVIEIGDRIVDETAGEVTFAVTLNRPSTGTVKINYATAPGTAGTADYTTVTGTLAFAPGETVKTVSVPIANDTLAEGDERFDLALSSPVGATLPDPRGTATVAASDQTAVATPIISVDNVVVGESDGFAEFVVRLNAPSASIVEVSYNDSNETAANGSDYNAVSGTLNFAPGETVKTVRVPIIDDTAAEPREDFAFNLFSPSNAVIGNSQALATIVDNDAPTGTPVIEIGDRIVNESAGEATFAITLDRPSTGTVTVNYATAPGTAGTADYTTVTGTLAFAPGETVKTVSVPITNDTLAEGDERFDLALSAPVGATLPDPRGTATIAANDQTAVATPAISTGAVTVGEGNGFAEFTVRLSAPGTGIVGVSYGTTNGTALNGSDYNAVSGTLNFAPGETVKTVRVPVINDATIEPNETFSFSLSAPVNATIASGSTIVTATILDDDTAPVLSYGLSNDVYTVNQSTTRVIEGANGGTDLVRSSVTYTLPVNVENLTLTGAGSINGTGNASNNVIIGNAGNNTLAGLGGIDTVSYATAPAPVTVSLGVSGPQNTGGGGTDTLSGFENVTGSGFNDTLTGTSGANVISGGAGADVMTGGGGNDTYLVDNAGDVVNESAGGGTDTVIASVSYALAVGSAVEFLRAAPGAPGISLTGNEIANTITGGTGNDTLTGRGGADIITGGSGADVFVYQTLGDSTVAAAGRDTITDFSSVAGDKIDLHLIDAVSNVAGNQAFDFIGSNPFSGTPGELNETLVGGNTIIGGDVNGDKAADFSILLTGAHTLSSSDFIL